MTIHIKFKDEPTRDYDNVRMVSVYPNPDGNQVPELIIHHNDENRRTTYINMSRIQDFTIAT